MDRCFQGEWGFILGSSSGFGLGVAKELALRGMNIFGVHFDRRSAMEKINQEIESMKSNGVEVVFYNANAADEGKRQTTLQDIQEKVNGKPLRTFVHSLAFGTLKPFFADSPENEITQPQMEMTVNVMASSLVYWVRDLRQAGLIGQGSRIFAMTSSGGHRVWNDYGAVSAAKASLESNIRQIALELASEEVCANAICAGVTDTPALRKIPDHEVMLEGAKKRNPFKRLTTPEDVGKAIAALSLPECSWITGNVINVDGGEDIVG